MTQPTAVQLRELVTKWRELAATCRADAERLPEGFSARNELFRDAAQYKQSAWQVETILAAAEPAPEPQGGGEEYEATVQSFYSQAMRQLNEEGKRATQTSIREQAEILYTKHIAALTPKPSTPQADGEGDDDETPEPTVMQIEYARGYGDGIRDAERIAAERAEIATSKAPAEVTDEMVDRGWQAWIDYCVQPPKYPPHSRDCLRAALTAALRPASTTRAGEG